MDVTADITSAMWHFINASCNDESYIKIRRTRHEQGSRITLVAGGYPLFANGKITGGIGVGGGTDA